MTDHSHLRDLALAATPGPYRECGSEVLIGDHWWRPVEHAHYRNDANAAFIAACSPDVVLALLDEIDESKRIGLSMCRLAHNLVTTSGSGEYAAIIEARARLEGVEDVRDLATLLADSEERARNSERAHDNMRDQLATVTGERDEERAEVERLRANSGLAVRRQTIIDEVKWSLDAAGVPDTEPVPMRVDTLVADLSSTRQLLAAMTAARDEVCVRLQAWIDHGVPTEGACESLAYVITTLRRTGQ